ncbi:hypothetical protein BD413DRAFT_18053 [Trametes elegans]|nr:hypothetical protein BD413DRAFT_18053 [Trametes elegans]
MRVFSVALVASSLFAGIASALPAPNADSDLLKRTDSYDSGYSGSGSGYSGSDSSSGYSGSGSGSGYSGSGSSSGSGSYGGSSDSSYGGSKDSNYGSSSDDKNSYGSSSSSKMDDSKSTLKSESTSSKMDDHKSTYKSESTSTKMDDSKTTQSYEATSTQSYEATSTSAYQYTSTAEATSTATYGSGSSSWGNSGYNDCVQQCVASFGPPPASYTPPTSTSGGDSSGSSGSGATHTVIVAPTQGVLRYVPFAVNASVGDTVMFVWGANNHTVTKSSELELCNKTSNAPFASGEQNKPFTFTQLVNDTNPTFFYCGTPGHCQKGMFGMINPPSVYNAPSSVSQMMGSMASNSSGMAAMAAYTDKMTDGSTAAANWGQNLDMAKIPEWAQSSFLENVMYTRAFLGANRDVIQDDGSINLNTGSPMQLPTDMAQVNSVMDSGAAQASTSAGSNAAAVPSGSGTVASGAAAESQVAGKSNGAASTAASSALLGVAAIAAAVLAL